MDTTARFVGNTNEILTKRLNQLQQITDPFNKHYIFQDGLNFNFLFYLYTQNMVDLLNHIDELSPLEFQTKLNMLDLTSQEMQQYIIQ